MRAKWAVWPLAAAMAILALALVAAAPAQQDGRPPQPLYQDFFSGTVTVQGEHPPVGTEMVACIDLCADYQSRKVAIGASGAFTGLELAPTNPALIGRDVTFYIANQYGSIQADQTLRFDGVYNSLTVSLTFSDAIPDGVPTPAPTSTPAPASTPTPVPPDTLPDAPRHPRPDPRTNRHA